MHKDTLLNKEKQRAHNKAKHRGSFIARNYWLWVIVAFVFYPLSACFSALTEGGHILIRMQEALGVGFSSIAVTTLLVILIEGMKYFLGKGAVDDIQAGVFSEGGAYLAAFAVKVIGFIGITFYSINLSVNGAPLLNEHFRSNQKPVAGLLINTDSIKNYYQQLHTIPDQLIEDGRNMTWKGKVVSDGRALIKEAQQEKTKINDQLTKELDLAAEKNKEIETNYHLETEENGQWAMGFAGVGEVICLFCLIFIGIYDDGLASEANATASNYNQPGFRSQTNYSNNSLQNTYSPTPPNDNPTNSMQFNMPWIEHLNQHVDDSVATGGHSGGNAFSEYEPDVLTLALKHAESSEAKWKSKLEQNKGTKDTNLKHIDKWQEIQNVIKERLRNIS